MADGVNRVTLLGHLGADPELRMVGSGNAKLSLRIATTQSWLDRTTNTRKEETQWHSATVWGRRAEALAKFLSRGAKVYLEGSLRYSSYEATDGTKRYRTDINVNHLVLCSTRSVASSGPAPEDRFNEPDTSDYGANYGGNSNDDDIPF